MSAENDLALAYHMGYDDALAKRKPDASKAQVLAPYDLATENAKLRELVRILVHCMDEVDNCDSCPINGNPYDVSREWAACDTLYEMLCELGVEVDG